MLQRHKRVASLWCNTNAIKRRSINPMLNETFAKIVLNSDKIRDINGECVLTLFLRGKLPGALHLLAIVLWNQIING